ncbi:hypothetical protein ACNKU7_18670 [Microbulbifer sp. SA54]|uniref:hypothetical protein n=1 Tax=Microbulbifer sp. SA54 TaxID=3401577 RepID=UPI003AAE3788
MRKVIAIFVLGAMVGCASANKIVLPSGAVGYTINCSGTAVSISKCYEKAGAVCPGGYDVVSSHNQPGVMTGFDGNPIATSDKGMVVQCK